MVNRSVPAGHLAAGVPAKVLKDSSSWPRRIEPEDQWKLAKDIFVEFLGYLRGEGVAATSSESENAMDATIATAAGQRTMRLSRHELGGSGSDVTMFLGPLARHPPARLNGAWFDLLAKKKGGQSDEVAGEAESFLARYGMRFAPWDEA